MTPAGAGQLLLAVAIGALLPLEALMNARLGQGTRGPLFAAFVTCLGGAAALGMMLAVARPAAAASGWSAVPFWLWCGGALGATYLASATMLVPRLGAAGLICLVVLGQMLSSLLLDHYGVLDAPRRPADALRAAGAVLVAAGALLVVQPWRSAA